MTTGQQDETIAFLSNAASYGFPGALVERIETHCSIVFLVDDRAYKLKRAIAFSALDYGTVERREAACRAELALNRRTAPEIYLGVQAIRRLPRGDLAFAEDGPIVDWVVIMRRFDQGDLFDHLAEQKHLTPELIRALADEIAAFHEAAEGTPAFGGADGLRDAIEHNRRDHLTVAPILGHAGIEALRTASLAALARTADLLDRRRGEGKIRRCHGDLRLANICLFDDRPTLFDAVEFSDRVSCIDILFDLAFLLMDLHQRGLDVLANILLNRYLDVTGGTEGLAALPLMLSVRAATRTYALAGAAQRHARKNEAQYYAAAARSHLALASSLLKPAPPRLIAIGGVEGSAKTSIAHELAATYQPVPGARVLRSATAFRDVLRLSSHARLPATDDDATAETAHRRLASDAEQALRAGFTAIVDTSFVRRAHRQAIAAVASTAAVPFVGLWLGSSHDLQGDEGSGAAEWHAVKPGPTLAAMLAAARALVHADAVPKRRARSLRDHSHKGSS
ncbi:MAG: phosphotransferase [Alphaproteobacteria bacterium]|nr:phosphotransferase [Alphaproteobacteria bacterium]